MTNAKKKKTPKAGMTLGELKTWLDGYCSAQGSDWSPSPQQWKLIKNKILSVVESETVEPVYATAPNFPQQPQRTSYVEPQQFTGSSPERPLEHGVVGVTNNPTMIMHDGKLKTPDKGTAGGPSDFA